MEEVQPLTAATATTTLTATFGDGLSSPADTQTPADPSPEHPPSPKHENGLEVPAAKSPSPGQAINDEVQPSGALNSSTVFHPLYSFPGDAEAREAGETGEAKSSNSSIVEGRTPPTDERAADGGEAVSMLSSPTDSGVQPPDSLGGGSLKRQGREKRAGEPEMQPLAETPMDYAKLSPAFLGASQSSQLTSPGTSATTSQHVEDLSPEDAPPNPTVLHM